VNLTKADVARRCYVCGADVSQGVQSWASGICNACIQLMPCWRCGEPTNGYWPYLLCRPCINVVSEEEIAWVNDPTNQPGTPTWLMRPLGKEQGR
jgi:hypothetical protein